MNINYFIYGICAGVCYILLFTFSQIALPGEMCNVVLEVLCIILLGSFLKYKKYLQMQRVKLDKKLVFFAVLMGIGCAFFHSFNLLIPISGEISAQIPVQITFEDYLEMCLLIPILEELLFRGYIFRSFANHYSFKFALIASAAIFGILHGTIPQILITFIHGILLAYILFLTDNILYPILIHVTINFWNAEISIGACGVLLGIFGELLMLFAFRNIKKITRASF